MALSLAKMRRIKSLIQPHCQSSRSSDPRNSDDPQMRITGLNFAKLPTLNYGFTIQKSNSRKPSFSAISPAVQPAKIPATEAPKRRVMKKLRVSFDPCIRRPGTNTRASQKQQHTSVSKQNSHMISNPATCYPMSHQHKTSGSYSGSGVSSAGSSVIQYYPSIDPREIKLRKALIELAPPIITTKSWAIVNGRNGQLLFGKFEQERRQFASLTKIMTLHVVLEFAKKNNLDLKVLQVPISKNAAKINGTSARVRAGDVFSCYDLLYAMMLPSGNDVSLALAEFFGRLLIDQTEKKCFPVRQEKTSSATDTSSFIAKKSSFQSQTASGGEFSSSTQAKSITSRSSSMKSVEPQDYYPDEFESLNGFQEEPTEQQNEFKQQLYVERFILEMNRTATEIGLKYTTFMNPHGLSNHLQKSTSAQVGKMAAVAMHDPLFRKVCSTRYYSCKPINDEKYTYRWTNTHKMLDICGYNGIKTGITPAAGPCLATSYQVKDTHLIVILLDSKTMDHRWSQTSKLVNWCVSRLRRVVNIYGGSEGSVGEKCQHMIKKLKNIQTGI